MKKFIRKCLLLVLFTLGPAGVVNFLYTRTDHGKYNSEISKFKTVPDHIQIANIGSSHGLWSFDYRNVPYRTFNFALSAQVFPYDYAILSTYIDRFDENAVLFIPVSYFQITTKKSDFRDINARYYRFLDKQYIFDYSLMEKVNIFFLDYFTGPVIARLLHIIKNTPPDVPLDAPIQPDRSVTEEELVNYINREQSKPDTTKNNPRTIPINFGEEAGEEGFIHNTYMIRRIIELCYAHNIRPVLVSTPITYAYNNLYPETFFENFYRFTRELQVTYPSLLYFDYSRDKRFENDLSLFFDAIHLNIFGAEKFTTILMDDLKASGAFD